MEEKEKLDANFDMESALEAADSIIRDQALSIIRNNDPEIDKKIAELKEKYGEVSMYIFSPEEFYIYRPLKRSEYVKIMAEKKDDEDTDLKVINTCVVYPEVEFTGDEKAGTIETLSNLILYLSNFASNNPVVKL